MADKYLYQVSELTTLSPAELTQLLKEHGYDATDFDCVVPAEKAFAVEVLSNILEG